MACEKLGQLGVQISRDDLPGIVSALELEARVRRFCAEPLSWRHSDKRQDLDAGRAAEAEAKAVNDSKKVCKQDKVGGQASPRSKKLKQDWSQPLSKGSNGSQPLSSGTNSENGDALVERIPAQFDSLLPPGEGTVLRQSLGCESLDRALDGGIQRAALTEICGEAGCGKTQLVLGCLLSALLERDGSEAPRLFGKSVYLCSEGSAPSERLAEMASEICQGHRCGCSGPCSGLRLPVNAEPGDLLDRILIKEIHSVQELKSVIMRDLTTLLESLNCSSNDKGCEPVRLVVIDSIAAIFRAEFENTMQSLQQRNAILLKISQVLRDLGDQFDCCFLVVNQVSADFSKKTVGPECALKAALGLVWSNSINARIMLRRSNTKSPVSGPTDHATHANAPLTWRTLQVIFSPVHPDMQVDYVITRGGICALNV